MIKRLKKGEIIMKETDWTKVRKSFKVGDVVWACAFERTNNTKSMLCFQQPILGMFTNRRVLESEIDTRTKYTNLDIRYFVPFKKNCKAYTLDNLAWSKATNISARMYATTEKECKDLYNSLIDNVIAYHEQVIDEMSEYYI